MARTKRSAKLDSRNKRLGLPLGKRATETLAEGRYVVYYRPENGASGSWSARWRHPDTGKFEQLKLGVADDFTDADGVKVLDYAAATERAGEWFKERERLAHLEATGEVISDSPITVGECLDDYITEARLAGRPMAGVEGYVRTRIRPFLGDVTLPQLTKKRIQDWLQALAASPRRKTGQKCSEEGEWKGPPTEEQLKARKSTANRILTILKRALTLAVENGRYSGAEPWRSVKPFRDAGGVRLRFLSVEEQQRLVNACPPDFRALVQAALYTGSRFSPLTRLQVRDFNPEAGTIFIQKDKGQGDTSRYVALDAEGVAWFASQVAGKRPDDLIFLRASAKRVTRKDGNPLRWMPNDQRDMMRAACKEAKLDDLTFHELRHTYASMLLNAGVPQVFVAKQLGHVDTRMVEKHYGHLCQTALTDAIRKLTPARGFDIPNVATLKPKKKRA